MKTRIASLLVTPALVLHAWAADPPKPRLVPRPVPGMSKDALKSDHQPAPSTAPITAKAASGDSPSPDKARIVAIYRRGTFTLPKELPATATLPSPESAKPTIAVPKPGQVRILTKAQADLIAAQPSP
ncbi:MAG: hypothetical protein JWO89_3289 [Verrucomicrobiaceae bacterium]|nr:hypothetical protein [Verrucomicrobiaceae bacterium]MDB6116945.1 hypothetical protein [Verrucomicrobiaceae bacterium]